MDSFTNLDIVSKATVINLVINLFNKCLQHFRPYRQLKIREKCDDAIYEEQYKKSMEQYINEIDNSNIQEPNPSILLPAMSESLIYIRETEVRNMFAKLIASSFDESKTEHLHPGFIGIIKQLSPTDARILSYINNHKDFIGLICLKENNEYPIINSSNLINELGIEQIALSLFNLKRLGLITVDSRLLLEKYPLFSKPIDSSLEDVSDEIKNLVSKDEYELHSNDTFLTQLGKSFLKVCIE